MTNHPTLFPPLSRRTDPVTSYMAGHEVRANGTVSFQQQVILHYLGAYPCRTAREIEAATGIKAHKRLPELRDNGLVVNGEARACRVSGRRAMTWLLKGN